jgi:carbamoyltransferase
MLILGLSSLDHDIAAALLRDGEVVAAIENDKLIRSGMRGLPQEAIKFCLDKAGATWSDLEAVAVASGPVEGWMRRSLLRARLAPLSVRASAYYEVNELGRLARELNHRRVLRQLHGKKAKVINLNHHLCHAASAFYQSPYDRALILTLDHEGDGTSGLIALGEGGKIRALRRIAFPNSIAWVYSQVTELLGFAPRKDEHKTQWLSLEGEPVYKDLFLKILRRPGSPLPHLNLSYFNRGLVGRLAFSDRFYKELDLPRPLKLTDEQRRALAASVQQACAQVVVDLLQHFRERQKVDDICLGGGLFLNSLLVSDVEKKLGFEHVYVPPAPGNAGSAVGAALLVWHGNMLKPRRTAKLGGPYWGPSFSRTEIKDTLDNSKARYSLQITEDRKLDMAVQLLHGGKIVGWYQGATEFGPRALGNRSVIASPWADYVKENLNDYIKHREWFRPFALAIPEEDCERWFEASPSCRYMNSLATAKPAQNGLPEGFLLPGNRVRLHVVSREANPAFWKLLKRFGETAPAPILVNTSFNLFGEPLVVKPRDAMRSYFCSGVDALIIDNFVLAKSTVSHLAVTTRITNTA